MSIFFRRPNIIIYNLYLHIYLIFTQLTKLYMYFYTFSTFTFVKSIIYIYIYAAICLCLFSSHVDIIIWPRLYYYLLYTIRYNNLYGSQRIFRCDLKILGPDTIGYYYVLKYFGRQVIHHKYFTVLKPNYIKFQFHKKKTANTFP